MYIFHRNHQEFCSLLDILYQVVYNCNMSATQGRPKSFDENEALALAMRYFWEHGYENTSLDNLLPAMGIKKSSFYHTFKSKEELFSRCLVFYRKETRKKMLELKQQIGPKRVMLALTEMTLQELEETGKIKGCLIMNSGKECYKRYTDLSHQIGIEFNFMLEMLNGFVKEAQDKGEITSTKDASVIAGRYMSVLNGLIVGIQAGASQELINDITLSLRELLE
jgi:TetR/AcrR family transcriptional regulator, transcriptional repressor for nem operon